LKTISRLSNREAGFIFLLGRKKLMSKKTKEGKNEEMAFDGGVSANGRSAVRGKGSGHGNLVA
jgi:hypothetical protein